MITQLHPDCVPCPACLDGERWEDGPVCHGHGYYGGLESHDGDCAACGGSGGGTIGPCTLCKGAGQLPLHLVRLKEADDWVRRQHPDWDGDDASAVGTTVYSKAMWYRRRDQVKAIIEARGLFKLLPSPFNPAAQLAIVVLTSVAGEEIVLHGVSWGYGGTGPSGLACILVDAGFFPTYEDAKTWVMYQHQYRPWQLRKGLVS